MTDLSLKPQPEVEVPAMPVPLGFVISYFMSCKMTWERKEVTLYRYPKIESRQICRERRCSLGCSS
jgi:hypothetical protein